MKLAVIGSRKISDISISKHIPGNVSEIVSGGARGICFEIDISEIFLEPITANFISHSMNTF